MYLVNCDRDSRRIPEQGAKVFKSPCGTAEEVSERVGRCLDTLFELVEGKFGDPKGDEDLAGHCGRFNSTERCVRTIAKDCLSGLHKTATSAVASATRRFRQQECRSVASRARYLDPLKCAIKKGKDMSEVYKNHTAIAQGIRDLDIPPEEKLVKMCCMLNALDKEIELQFNRECPKSTPLVVGIVHAMTDDARSTLCVNPKCNRALDKVINTRYKPPQNFIEPIAQILYQLNVD